MYVGTQLDLLLGIFVQVLPVVSTVPRCTSRAIQISGRVLMLTTVSVTAIVYLLSVIFV